MLKVIDEKTRVRIKMEVGDIELSGYGADTTSAIRDLAKQVDYRLFDRYLGDPENIWPLGENFTHNTVHRLNRALDDGFEIEVTLINADRCIETVAYEDEYSPEKLLSMKKDGFDIQRIELYIEEKDESLEFAYYLWDGGLTTKIEFRLGGTEIFVQSEYPQDKFIDTFYDRAARHILNTFLPVKSQF